MVGLANSIFHRLIGASMVLASWLCIAMSSTKARPLDKVSVGIENTHFLSVMNSTKTIAIFGSFSLVSFITAEG
jgi:hypothetical protein